MGRQIVALLNSIAGNGIRSQQNSILTNVHEYGVLLSMLGSKSELYICDVDVIHIFRDSECETTLLIL